MKKILWMSNRMMRPNIIAGLVASYTGELQRPEVEHIKNIDAGLFCLINDKPNPLREMGTAWQQKSQLQELLKKYEFVVMPDKMVSALYVFSQMPLTSTALIYHPAKRGSNFTFMKRNIATNGMPLSIRTAYNDAKETVLQQMKQEVDLSTKQMTNTND